MNNDVAWARDLVARLNRGEPVALAPAAVNTLIKAFAEVDRMREDAARHLALQTIRADWLVRERDAAENVIVRLKGRVLEAIDHECEP